MNNKISLSIDYYGTRHTTTVSFDIEKYSRHEEVFQVSYNEGSAAMPAMEQIAFEITPQIEIALILKNRKAVAKRIAEEMTEFLLNQMAARDTKNGYKIGE